MYYIHLDIYIYFFFFVHIYKRFILVRLPFSDSCGHLGLDVCNSSSSHLLMFSTQHYFCSHLGLVVCNISLLGFFFFHIFHEDFLITWRIFNLISFICPYQVLVRHLYFPPLGQKKFNLILHPVCLICMPRAVKRPLLRHESLYPITLAPFVQLE